MGKSRRATLLGGLLVALCSLACVAWPLLLAAGIGAGVALAVGGAVVAGIALAAVAVVVYLVVRRRRGAEACRILPEDAGAPGSVTTDRRVAETGER